MKTIQVCDEAYDKALEVFNEVNQSVIKTPETLFEYAIYLLSHSLRNDVQLPSRFRTEGTKRHNPWKK